MKRIGRRMVPRLLSVALLAVFALFWSQPARTAGDTRSYVVYCDSELSVLSVPETSPEELAAMCGYDPEEYIIGVAERDGYTLVTLHTALDVTLEADGVTREIRATGGTVADLLEEFDISLRADDIISHDADTPLEDGMTVMIGRVTFGEIYEEKVIPHGIVYQDSSSLYKGTEQTVTQGADGLERVSYRVRYVDGVESDRELLGRETVTEAVDTVIARGTKEKETPKPASSTSGSVGSSSGQSGSGSGGSANHTVSGGEGTITTSSGEVLSYTKCLIMNATAYSVPAGSMTSSGAPVQVGIVAALPSTLPPGTRVYIVTLDGQYTYGPAVVGDTPGSDIIDLFFDTVEECYQFGVRNAYVYVLS